MLQPSLEKQLDLRGWYEVMVALKSGGGGCLRSPKPFQLTPKDNQLLTKWETKVIIWATEADKPELRSASLISFLQASILSKMS